VEDLYTYLRKYLSEKFKYDFENYRDSATKNFFSCPNCGLALTSNGADLLRWSKIGPRMNLRLDISESPNDWRQELDNFFFGPESASETSLEKSRKEYLESATKNGFCAHLRQLAEYLSKKGVSLNYSYSFFHDQPQLCAHVSAFLELGLLRKKLNLTEIVKDRYYVDDPNPHETECGFECIEHGSYIMGHGKKGINGALPIE